ncbi:hypothetical protein SAMN04490243_1131 [Robiginitalea myxolifaciens]|uniref:O-Antigen ligase n=1 Tax=Robiginitalea myxolifaciens TaxID=400055 RepID=A0A1I6G2G7_9FLAO|nr:hypothetical protein [Robiginitalea myxolifaciens]SFR36405.1 hypothetical protein SAMN04490243_1131 [Robiginitalea myxolifaciens]
MKISRRQASIAFVVLILLISLSFLRATLIFLYPVLACCLAYLFRQKLDRESALFLVGFLILAFLSSWISGGYFFNLAVSLYLILPVWIFLRARVTPSPGFAGQPLFDQCMNYFALILAVVNVSALIYSQFIVNTGISNYEDAFTGLYGHGGFGSHTLSLVNLGISVYFLDRKAYLKFAFFLLSGIMGFYGLGLLIFLASLGILYFSQILKYWKVLLVLLICGFIGFGFISLFNARNLDYIEKNIAQSLLIFESYDYQEEMQKSAEMKITEIPRFLTFLDGASQRVTASPKNALLGVAPGGYNSRTAFYLNGDFVQNEFLLQNFQIQTPAHTEDIFPLLNRELIQRPFNDGTRNQTFSSFVSVLLEYGLLAGGGFLLLFFLGIRRVARMYQGSGPANYIRFLGIYLFVLFLAQNYLEYPEVVFLFLLVVKLAEVDAANNNIPEE